jgi:hypothetical protein
MQSVRRLIVMCERPMHLAADEAAAWLRREAAEISGKDGIYKVELTVLESAPLRWGRVWDWLIEIDLGSQPDALAKGSRCATLLADLRLLGMRPAVAVADPSKKQLFGDRR